MPSKTDPLPGLRSDPAVEPSLAPKHVAIIMDGNGRWAEARGLPRIAGHRAGVEAVRRTVRAAADLGIPYLTIYSFSSENWSRPASEVGFLMGLMRRYIQQDLAELHAQNVRIRMIGERDRVDADLLELIDEAVATTRHNTKLNLSICFNYGARGEIAKAARRLAEDVRDGRLAPEAITPELLDSVLDTYGLPDPDLLVRTSGEIRLSNFLLWQMAYTEFVFLDVFWPDFGKEQLAEAVQIFARRTRRFGGLNPETTAP